MTEAFGNRPGRLAEYPAVFEEPPRQLRNSQAPVLAGYGYGYGVDEAEPSAKAARIGRA